jgi:site-specific DNA recombinase
MANKIIKKHEVKIIMKVQNTNQMEDKKNAIIYCRVSSAEQAENFSLAQQLDACRQFAGKEKYTIIKELINKRGESAKTTDRPELKKLLEFVGKEKKRINALILWKYDRLARNMADYADLLSLFSKLNIQVISVSEPADYSSAGKLMRNIIGSFAQYENDVKSDRTIAGMKQAIKEGRWAWHAPYGYKFSRDEYGKSLLIPDGEKAEYVQKAFEIAEKGIYKQTEIISQLRGLGCPKMTKQMLNRILNQPLYAGYIIKKEWFDEPIRGIHKPLISIEHFEKVQSILKGKKPKLLSYSRLNPVFPLRRLIRCPYCKQPVSGSFNRGRNKTLYPHYHCKKGGCGFGNIRIEKLHFDFIQLLKKIKPERDSLDLFCAIVKDVWNSKKSNEINEKEKLIRKINILNERKNKLIDFLIDGTVTKEERRIKSNEISEQVDNLQREYNSIISENLNIDDCIEFCRRLFANPHELWEKSDIETKQRFQQFIFPNGIEYKKDSFVGTPVTALIFNVLQENQAKESFHTPRAGFEPATQWLTATCSAS